MPLCHHVWNNHYFIMNEGDTRTYVRRYLHDMRNHLNAVEMDALLLGLTSPEAEGAGEAVKRIRAEVSLMEGLLGGFAVRFGTLDLQWIPAEDVFTRWRSRSGKVGTSPCLSWRSEVGGEAICVDLNALATALCELLPVGRSGLSAEVSVRAHDGGVQFQVLEEVRDAGAETVPTPPPPGFEDVIARNGGRYQRERDQETGRQSAWCWFPCRGEPTLESHSLPDLPAAPAAS